VIHSRLSQSGRSLGAALALALALAGCGAAKVGTAAVVGDERISITQLQANVERILAERDASEAAPGTPGSAAPDRSDVTSGELTRQLLGRMIQSRLLEVVAADLGVPPVTDGQVDQALAQLRTESGQRFIDQRAVELSIARRDVREYVRAETLAVAVLRKLGPEPRTQEQLDALQARLGQELAKAERKVGVTVNPRYGRWDSTTRQIVPVEDGLTEPGAGATPAPTAP
jgi:SurA N-terminal domain